MAPFIRTIGFFNPGAKKEVLFDVGVVAPVDLPKIPNWGRITAVIEDDGVAIDGQLPDALPEAKPVRVTHLSASNRTHGFLDMDHFDGTPESRRYFYLTLRA